MLIQHEQEGREVRRLSQAAEVQWRREVVLHAAAGAIHRIVSGRSAGPRSWAHLRACKRLCPAQRRCRSPLDDANGPNSRGVGIIRQLALRRNLFHMKMKRHRGELWLNASDPSIVLEHEHEQKGNLNGAPRSNTLSVALPGPARRQRRRLNSAGQWRQASCGRFLPRLAGVSRETV